MRQLLILIQKEFIQIFRNPLLPKLILVFPVMVMLVMPWVTTMDVRNVGVAIIDEDCSTLSYRITSDIRAAEYFTINDEPNTHEEALRLLEDSKIDIILLIPDDFERNITSVSPKKLDVSANAVNATKGSLGSQYLVQTIASTMSKYMSEQGSSQTPDFIVVQNRYNPTLNYRNLMIPALMIMLVILICGFLSSVNIVSEKENGTIEQINVTPIGKFTFVLAKLIPCKTDSFLADRIVRRHCSYDCCLACLRSRSCRFFGKYLFRHDIIHSLFLRFRRDYRQYFG